MRIELAPRAVRDALRRARWWREKRPAAPTLFEDELRESLAAIARAPELGSVYRVVRGREHRRVLMPRTRHHVYYRAAGDDLLYVLAIWNAVAARGPSF